jgi:plastocyanin
MKKTVTLLAFVVATAGLLVISSCSNSTSPYGGSSSSGPYGSGSGTSSGSGSGSSGSGGNPSSGAVKMIYSSFSPATLTVAKGSTVTWTNQDGMTHTTTSDAGNWDLSVASGTSKSVTFNNAGTYKYHCSIHPYMTGSIVVQ